MCVLCNDQETELHINHKKYTKEPWDAPNNDLETLCKDCHILIHTEKEPIYKVYKIKNDGFISIVYKNDLGSNWGILENNVFTKHCGFLFNSESLEVLYKINRKDVENG